MLSISASNGGGLVPYTEVAEALGMFQLQHSDYIVPPGYGGTIQEFLESDGKLHWEFAYKGRLWRVQVVYGPIPYATRPMPIRIHFDYIRPA